MAMQMTVDGMDELGAMLRKLGDQADYVAKRSLYAGAGIMADGFEKATESIRTEPFRGKKDMRLPSPEEKNALIGRTGIARFNVNGDGADTLVGLSANGYVKLGNTPTAVRLIARTINSGTSFMEKQPVYRKAKTQFSKSASDAIVSKAEQMYNEIINGEE